MTEDESIKSIELKKKFDTAIDEYLESQYPGTKKNISDKDVKIVINSLILTIADTVSFFLNPSDQKTVIKIIKKVMESYNKRNSSAKQEENGLKE